MKQSYRINDVLTLRVPATSDAHQLYSLIAHDQKELQRWLPWAKTTLSPADEEAFILYSLGQIQEGKLWSATLCVADTPAGTIDIHEISMQNARGQVGYWLGQKYQGKGFMTQALTKVIEVAFSELELHRLELITDSRNKKSQKVATRAGFKRECCLHDYLREEADFHDAFLYVLFSK
ncbi:GNAT family N-acetyltransferase [Liquorilactobacillus satsumensis]|uniref:N-acetyltransferase GCN5 n=1 Tax=Liquorilactobacillus satsumensis DSM 16230 = JCM 12392 TaxID=1423801 RepID=A0A0R1V122_9LACO|nr:GNAT family protein [Liquorilactobacillus satsumensis]KRL98788.1 N-acetyltransferase GCN5 [Liquorilactobacillus satsumensis DSM 16230 = JCM 12392]MCP9313101.1 GNAT family N-acetyltransferase [Liquorilactobacillus satsumensis]MCP9328034.1 GNAT family N-acetyltransferase [Liquorilactobacillus satsumensis]MCP9358348.1 GNAT family N-acetyltransferase [Liquorilactobacillus satsumensis]MCP9359285.1 GNAT family N-acetyltransferase [Liquorilactobacillus satsumensis]